MDPSQFEIQLQEDMGSFFYDPYAFVMYAFEWDKEPLVRFEGPDVWQVELMQDIGRRVRENDFNGRDPVDPVREAVTSGHGVGKSALTAWLILWIMSTRPHAKGVVTANTGDQLRTKTWAELGKWKKRCITGHWFEYNNTKGNMNMYHKAYPESWRVDGQTCREENSESFAGLHAANSSPFYIFDEASAVPDIIWEVAEGGMTDGEPFWFAFGNPTRNKGRFRECFRKFRDRWSHYRVDSRTAKMTNKKQINEWIEDYGLDSDFVKVRVLGQFPMQSDTQYFGEDLWIAASKREIPMDDQLSPMIWGIDFGRQGSDPTVIRGRRGRNGKPFKPIKIKEKDSMRLAGMIAEKVAEASRNPMTKPDKIFGDGGGLGGPIIDALKRLGVDIVEVNFQNKADDADHYANKRAEMTGRCKDWAIEGGCVEGDDEMLKEDLLVDEMKWDRKDRLLVQSKDDIRDELGRSPDDGDAFKLTFAYHVPLRSSILSDHFSGNISHQTRVVSDDNLGFRSDRSGNRCAVAD